MKLRKNTPDNRLDTFAFLCVHTIFGKKYFFAISHWKAFLSSDQTVPVISHIVFWTTPNFRWRRCASKVFLSVMSTLHWNWRNAFQRFNFGLSTHSLVYFVLVKDAIKLQGFLNKEKCEWHECFMTLIPCTVWPRH